MRLHRLRVTAFQAFAAGEQVDFDALSEAGLFLLHGDTGAGKTTLLDAVCFALYGTVPGARARDARLRSDHADPATRTEVELEATLRERRLRIVRRPRQERPKLRGEGFTEEAPTCTVEELVDGTWSVLAARRDEADAELGELIGMSCDQFCQVVLLPQGEFATFLRADSGERQAVLERLFGTDRFTRVEQWLNDGRRTAGAELRRRMEVVRDLVSRLSEAAGEESPEDLDRVAEWVAGLGVRVQAELVAASGALAPAVSARAQAERDLAAGIELAKRRADHATALAELAAWEERRPARDAAEAELAAARRAAPLRSGLTPDSRLEICWSTAPVDLHSSPEGLRARAAEARGEAGALDALLAVEERLARDDAELQRLSEHADEAANRAQAAASALAAAAEERISLDASITAARGATERGERLQAEAAQAGVRAEMAAERDRLVERLAAAGAAVREAVDAEQRAREGWLEIREQRLAGMAAELAAGLADGEPCAVCGATEHPAPASGPSLDAPAEREREAQREHGRLAEARTAAEQARATVETALAAAGAVAGDEPAAALGAAAARLAAELAAADAQAATLTQVEQAIAALDAQRDSHERAHREALQTEAETRATHAARTSVLGADRARVEEARGAAPSVAARADALRAEADAAEQQAAAREAGFDGADAARAALRDDVAMEDLAQRVRAFDAGIARRTAKAQDLELLAAAAADPPEIAPLEAHAAAAREADAEATGRQRIAQQRQDGVTRLAADLEQALEALAPVAERERRVRELAALVDGSSVSNRLHMKLSAYVLAARLEEVAAAASVRLERMSDGRYRLVHTDERARGERRAGLELRVVDDWTGRERAPGTLSGGETFLASLALALGLADVVAAEAGGSRLETLFVDEGFGSLDERTLDEVLDVLDGLREGGRAVGIVSHVAELRQRIPARLHVVKGRDGSHVVQRAIGAAAA